MNIPLNYNPLKVDGVAHDLSHLSAFAVSIPGKGVEVGTDLGVVVVFSCHVFTERAKHGDASHMVDHHQTRRVFDPVRYDMSLELPERISAKIKGDGLTFISKSFGGIDNLILLEDRNGTNWTIVYCLVAIQDGTAVRMEILSAHPKLVDQKKISRRNFSYFARMCLFGDSDRIPKK